MIKGFAAVKESSKTPDWIKERAERLYTLARSNAGAKLTDIKCWRYFNNQWNQGDFEYLTKTGDFEFPAKIRWVPLQRQNANLLISTYTVRPFLTSIYLSDFDSKNKKFERQALDFVKNVEKYMRNSYRQKQTAMMQIMMKKQQIEQAMSKEPESEEEAMQLQQLQQTMPLINQQFQNIQESFEQSMVLPEDELERLEKYYQYEDKEISEEMAQVAKSKIIKELKVKDIAVEAFISNIVVGKEYYLVEYQEGQRWPTFKALNPMKVYFPSVDGIRSVQKGPWAAYEEGMSYEQVIQQWGDKLSEEEKESLLNYVDTSDNWTFYPTMQGGAIPATDTLYSGSYTNNTENINVFRLWFKSERKVHRKITEKDFGDGTVKTFSHIIEEEAVEKEKGKGKLEIKYVDDLYEATIINHNIVVECKKKTSIVRDPDNPSEINIPIFGPSFNNITTQPFSIIYNTMGLQELWVLVNYHEELLLAASGVRGQIVDMSQKPDGMSIEEQRYHKKLGTLYIQTTDKNGQPKNNSFNQWRDFDDSVSPAIQYLEVMKQNLEVLMGNMMGVPRARQGDIAKTDQVGTFEKSIQQSSMITEILYYNHDKWLSEALSELLNLALTYSFRFEDLVEMPVSDDAITYVKIPEHIFDNTYWSLKLMPGGLEEQKLVELKQFSLQNWKQGAMNFNDFLGIYTQESVVSLKKTLENLERKAQKIAQMNREQSKQDAIEIEKAKVQFAKEYDMAMKQQEFQLKAADQKLKEYDMQIKHQIEGAKLQAQQQNMAMQAQKNADDKEVKMADIGSEREIEMSYLAEQHRANTVNEKLQALELQLNTIIQQNQLLLQAGQGVEKNSLDFVKSQIDFSKQAVQKKEKIK